MSRRRATIRQSRSHEESPSQEPSPTLQEGHSGSISQPSHSPLFISQDGTPSPQETSSVQKLSSIDVPSIERPWEYATYEEEDVVEEIIKANSAQGSKHLVRLSNGRELTVTFSQLHKLEGGDAALELFEQEDRETTEASLSEESARPTRRRAQPRQAASKPILITDSASSEDELATTHTASVRKKMKLTQPKQKGRKSDRYESGYISGTSEIARRQSGRVRKKAGRPSHQEIVVPSESDRDDEDDEDNESDEGPRQRKRKRGPDTDAYAQPYGSRVPTAQGGRRSSRARRPANDLHERSENDIPEVDISKGIPKTIGAKEAFQPLPKDNDFRLRHNQSCDTCYEIGSNEEKGDLIYCQGCSMSYHQRCLGTRNFREHLVTKIDDANFILQCRRCVQVAFHKDHSAPKQGNCHACSGKGPSTKPFRSRQSTREEQKAKENNDGEDPVSEVPSDLINNVSNILFRCTNCYQAFHMHHLQSSDNMVIEPEDMNSEELAAKRFTEYSRHWTCLDCLGVPGEVESLVAWRPINASDYNPAAAINEDNKEYLVRWKKLSYFKCTWMSGAWVWGVAAASMRKAFAKRDDNLRLTTEDAIPEDYLRVDIVFDVNYTNVVKSNTEKMDKARIKEVGQALVKFKGLGYDDVVWEETPSQDDSDRWSDFKTAYYDWVSARYIHLPKQTTLQAYISKLRAQDFAKNIEMQNQPANLTGGELMKYQLEGLNWLYYQWHKKQNAILADEMGLGKTIQVIGFFATLKLHGCWPFLIVVPNSTCANWRREIKLWAPSLRVVTYFGSAEAKKLIYKHELFHLPSKDLKCHVVVTSYDAAQDDEFRRTFRGVNWMGLVVDEGQRLKNDKNILYGALNALRVPFKLLLTGTPLQNNQRELFNLLQFLDPAMDAQAMESEYETLTKDNIPRLHELLKPFFLRRTKAQVLDFLPSMAQIIIPVTLTVVQKKLYKSILAKNQDLIRTIFGGSARLQKTERVNLNNILMQLRKCLCHPFVYSRDIEEKSSNPIVSHRNLVDASSKLQLLEIMLPKLQERGHRVLIFSQFLDMLDMVEDFLDGLGLYYQRLDGSLSSLQKQKRIDEFNAPESPLFAFLLSTRAGGVGINLATADTVIILDPDFNPHQDIQALSRAHRIGQKKKVLVFQLVTRSSAEEKIMQVGKKKMAMDHVLIEQMDQEDDAGMDVESMLRHGAEAIFQDEVEDIRYDPQSVDKLLDRSQVENTSIGKDDSAESQFSFARVWANEKGRLEDSLGLDESESNTPDPSLWEKILKEREEEVAREAAARHQTLGRGKRVRQTVDYASEGREAVVGSSPNKRVGVNEDDSDTDFQEEKVASEPEEEDSGVETEEVNIQELQPNDRKRGSRGRLVTQTSPSQGRAFKRVKLSPPLEVAGASKRVILSPPPAINGSSNLSPHTAVAPPQPLREVDNNAVPAACLACDQMHPVGFCPLKHAGVENCPLCGIAHFGHFRTCPHLSSLTQCRRMLEALKQSNEPAAEKKLAKQYVVGIIGDLTRRRMLEEQKAQQEAGVQPAPVSPNTARAEAPAPRRLESLMYRGTNGGQDPSINSSPAGQVSAKFPTHQGVNGGALATPNQQAAVGYSTYSLPAGYQLVNGTPHINGSGSDTGGHRIPTAHATGYAAGSIRRTGGSSS